MCGSFALLPHLAGAQTLQITLQGITLNANLVEPADAKEIYLLVHGTWGHYDMEIMAALQQGLADRDVASLAINLSLGKSDRHGFLTCEPQMRPNHEAAVAEIDHWLGYLKNQGWAQPAILGHSRGAAQVALYQQQHPDNGVSRLVLLAPMVVDRSAMVARYNSQTDFHANSEGAGDTHELAAVLETAERAGSRLIGPHALLQCEQVRAPGTTFISYYGAGTERHVPRLLRSVAIPTAVFLGTDDSIAPWSLADRTAVQSLATTRVHFIEGADHFFRDLYLDDVLDLWFDTP
jgi:pimeloyl-ACP methyl ester carboxylesterase